MADSAQASEATGAAAFPAASFAATGVVSAGAIVPAYDDGRRDSSLHTAASSGEVAAILAAATVPTEAVRAVGSLGRVPLHSAAAAGLADVVSALTAAGAPPTPRDDDNVTPLHLAARGGHVAAIAALLAARARVDARDGEGALPLHYACDGGSAAAIHMLAAAKDLGKKAPKDHSGRTPLMRAAAADSVEAVDAVLALWPFDAGGRVRLGRARRGGRASGAGTRPSPYRCYRAWRTAPYTPALILSALRPHLPFAGCCCSSRSRCQRRRLLRASPPSITRVQPERARW
jgi:ankyrin repeat protein